MFLNGYEVDAYGYILKPIKQESISLLLKKIKDKISLIEPSITIKTLDGIVSFYESEINYIESDNQNTNIIASKGKWASNNKMSQWKKELFEEKFPK